MSNDHMKSIWIGARVAVVGVLLPVLVFQVWNRSKAQTPRLSSRQDFILDSPTAVSNALRFNEPPEGWDIVCNQNQMFSPRHDTFVYEIYDNPTTVRTSRYEAVVAAWRITEVLEGVEAAERRKDKSTNVWKACDGSNAYPTPSPVTYNTNVIDTTNRSLRQYLGLIDEKITLGTNNIAVGYHAGWTLWTNSNVVLIGRNAKTTNDSELVIRFVDAPEFRMKLPGVVDMRGMYPSWPLPSSTK